MWYHSLPPWERERRRKRKQAKYLVIGSVIGFIAAFFVLNPSSLNIDFSGFENILKNSPVPSAEIESAVLMYTNIERTNAGVNQLKWDTKLAEIAREHSLDMASNNYFSHDNLRGETPTDRAIKHGYIVTKELGGGWTSEGIGENIGAMPIGDVVGYGYVSKDANSIANAIVASWMSSAGHRENILDSQYTKIGIGVAYDESEHIYKATQDFW